MKVIACHYYPECPEPELTVGITPHANNSLLTMVAQYQTRGLQFLHENKYWVDAQPILGALVVNIRDLLQRGGTRRRAMKTTGDDEQR
ncbi:Isopenicillin N synthase-like [Parasponia andersonii]|uniref:Isopenicillin N synthase-like n=1 Tax=Parasponia andersonii TaxID=3476 RepID=A0A2P5DPZ0_PARAD|nr:Isopenicillin N synthase-like [Parasponia andersonii]